MELSFIIYLYSLLIVKWTGSNLYTCFLLPSISEDSWGTSVSPDHVLLWFYWTQHLFCSCLFLLPLSMQHQQQLTRLWLSSSNHPHIAVWAIAFTNGLAVIVGWGPHRLTEEETLQNWNLAISILNSPIAIASTDISLKQSFLLEKTFLQGAPSPYCSHTPLHFFWGYLPLRGFLCSIQILLIKKYIKRHLFLSFTVL